MINGEIRNRETSFSIHELPSDPIEKRAWLLREAVFGSIPDAVEFTKNGYHQTELLVNCMDFVSNELLDAPSADLRSLGKVFYFPWTEASREFEQAFNASLLTMYKAAHDHLRRALELIIVGIYFTLERTPDEEAKQWMSNRGRTPAFRKALSGILEHHRFKSFNERCCWEKVITELYDRLSGTTHVRGQEFGFQSLQPSFVHLGDVSVPQLHATAMTRVLDLFVEISRQVATAVALSNPIILVPRDMESKFGINVPPSGFYWEPEVERVRRLIPDDYLIAIDQLLETDSEFRAIIEWFERQPDISTEELAVQAEQLRAQFSSGE